MENKGSIKEEDMTLNLNKTLPLATREQPHEWGILEWRLDDSLATGAGMSVAVMTLHPGKTSPLHRHPNCHEFIYVSRGRVEVVLEGHKVVLDMGDSMLSPLGTSHSLQNPGETKAQLVLSYSAGKRIYEEI